MVVTFGSQSIKTPHVILYNVFLCISKWPISYYFKNKLRTIQRQNLGEIENSQPESQYTGSYERECITLLLNLFLLSLFGILCAIEYSFF